MKNNISRFQKIISLTLAIVCIIACTVAFSACSKNPTKLIFKNSPYVENKPEETSDWRSFTFEINKDGSYSFEFAHHRYSVSKRTFTDIDFDKVTGTWEFVGQYDQDYVVYKTNARLVSVPKKQSLAIYKLNGLQGGFYGEVAEDGTVTKSIGTMQGYCVYKYGDNTAWATGKPEGIAIFFTDEAINEALLDKSIDESTLSTCWRYGDIGECNYSHTVKI